MIGTVTWWSSQKGFGWIQVEDGPDYWVHHSDIKGEGFKNLEEGEIVHFEPVTTEKGPRATRVSRVR